jgi:hypothetical protein
MNRCFIVKLTGSKIIKQHQQNINNPKYSFFTKYKFLEKGKSKVFAGG